tara:strand:- start:799 stop:945 length:147 start_codon:yes stop_codon:yes gene_type:complete
MESLDALLEDPVIQLLLMVIVAVGVFDAFKFAMSWVWKKLGGKDEEFK